MACIRGNALLAICERASPSSHLGVTMAVGECIISSGSFDLWRNGAALTGNLRIGVEFAAGLRVHAMFALQTVLPFRSLYQRRGVQPCRC